MRRTLYCPVCYEEVKGWSNSRTHCQGCGEPLLMAGIKYAQRDDGARRNNKIDYEIKIRRMLHGFVSEAVKRELARAAAFVVDSDDSSFPELMKIAVDGNLVCPWDGGLHYNAKCIKNLEAFYKKALADPDGYEAILVEEARRYLERSDDKI